MTASRLAIHSSVPMTTSKSEAGRLVEITLRGPSDVSHWTREITEFGQARCELIRCRQSPSGRRIERLLRVELDPGSVESFLRFLREKSPNAIVSVIYGHPARVLLWFEENVDSVCGRVLRESAVCLDCRLVGPTRAGQDWHVLAVNPRAMAKHSYNAWGSVGGWRVVRIRDAQVRTLLTERQRLALKHAYEVGFFETPRRGGLAAVALRLGVTRASAMELLRRATQRLLESQAERALR